MTPPVTKSISLSSRARRPEFSSEVKLAHDHCSQLMSAFHVWRGSFRRRGCNLAEGAFRGCDRDHGLVECPAKLGLDAPYAWCAVRLHSSLPQRSIVLGACAGAHLAHAPIHSSPIDPCVCRAGSRRPLRPPVMSSLQKRAEAAADPDTVAAEPPRLTHPEIRFVFYGLMLGGFLQALNQTIVASALPTIGRDLNDFQNLSWVVIAYLLVLDHRRAALRQARRHPWPPRHDDGGARPVHRRLGAVRGGARHGDADRRPHAARHRRRRHRADGADHRRRHGDPARARPLPGLYGHRLDHRRHASVPRSAASSRRTGTGR